jgi:predicted dehydrogenase
MSVQLAFIGAGGIASKHLEHLKSNEHADVTAVCDINPDAAEKWAQAHDAETYTDWEKLFDDGGFDAVFVCIPPFAHEGQELRAAREGVHLFVEKPLGLDPEYPAEVLAAVRDSGVITQVGHHMRYLETVQQAREYVGDRTLAAVYGKWVGGVPGGEDHWWRHRERSGGQVIEQSTHIFDLVRYFGGDVQQVSSEGDLRVKTDLLDFPDAVSATLRHENGLPSQVMTSAASPSWKNGITVVGDGVHLTVDSDTCEGIVDDEEVHFEADDDGHHTEVDAFVEAVREKDPSHCRSPYSDAIRTFEVTMAVTNAATKDHPVPVDP